MNHNGFSVNTLPKLTNMNELCGVKRDGIKIVYNYFFILLVSFSYGLNDKTLIRVLKKVPFELYDYDDATYSLIDSSL